MTAYDLGYQAYGNERQSEQALLHQYLPLVKRTVCSLKSHCGPLIGQEDMEQIALMALLEAARRYPVSMTPALSPLPARGSVAPFSMNCGAWIGGHARCASRHTHSTMWSGS